MTHHAPAATVRSVTAPTSRSAPLSRLGDLAQLGAALADRRALVARLEAGWVAAAEREVAKHLPGHVRVDDRGTWDGPTYARYMLEAERVEPSFKPQLRRLLAEIEVLERLMSPAPRPAQRAA